MLTIGEQYWRPDEFEYPNQLVHYVKGQLEIGTENGFRHWQIVAYFKRPVRVSTVRHAFGGHAHCEPTRSDAIEDYVWKEETAVPDTRFEYGQKSFKRNSSVDWDRVWHSAKSGDLEAVPAELRLRYYSTLRRIATDFLPADERPGIEVDVYWGVTGSGKSHRAWLEAIKAARTLGGQDAEPFSDAEIRRSLIYVKNPRTKWWDGYNGQKVVIIDEFRGVIGIEHMLTWLDKYPCNVEIKGSQLPLCAERFFITSNTALKDWYPNNPVVDTDALRRRISKVTHFSQKWARPCPPTPP